MSNLKGKSAIITGASKGIGAATARHFIEQGANVTMAARSEAALSELESELGANAMAAACDVSIYDDVFAVVSETKRRFGQIDIVINNAGVIDPVARIDKSDPIAWSHAFDINLKGVYYMYHAAIPHLSAGGTMINISSGAATGALEGWSHYCSSKAGVLSLTKCGHKEFGEKGLRFIGLSPGTVATDMQVQIKASGVNPVSQLDPSVHIPAEYVAKALAYLCGPGGDAHLGTDFSIKTDEGRAAVGLPPV